MTNAAKVSEALFTNVSDEKYRSIGFNLCFIQSAGDCENDGQPSAIVSDAWTRKHSAFAFDLNVHAFGKDRVQMRGQNQPWTIFRAGALADDVANRVNAHIL